MQKSFTHLIGRLAFASVLIFTSLNTNAQLTGGALHFDGNDDFVLVPNTAVLNQLPLTIEAWVKPEVRNDGTIVAQFPNNVISNDNGNSGHGFGVNVLSNGVSGITVDYNDGARYITVPMNAGQWYHVSVVYTTGNVKTYLNGTVIDNTSFAQATTTTSGAYINIGKFSDDISYSSRRFFKGSIEEVRVWNRALCQGEIINNMNCELNLPQNGLAAYYKFNQGLAGLANLLTTSLTDALGKNDGTLNNFGLLLGNTSNWIAGSISGTCSSYSLPAAIVTAQGPTIFCQGDSVKLSANFANSYQWYNFGTAIQGATSQYYRADQTGQYSVEVTTGNCAMMSDVTAVTVNAQPTVFISQSSTSICAGTPVSLSASGNNNALNALQFNTNSAQTNYLSIPHQSQLFPSTITIEAWVRPTQGNANSGLVSKLPLSGSQQIGYGFKQVASNRFQFIIGKEGSNVVAESNSFSVGPWYHLTGTYDGTTMKLYVNGSLQATTTANATINSTTPLIVGNLTSLSEPFAGTIDEVRVWNTVRSQQQIQCDYKNSVLPNEAGLAGYWKLNDGSGVVAKDATAYQNNGTLVNNPGWIVSSAAVGNAFTWDPTPGLSNVSTGCVTLIPPITTTFKVTGTNSAGCSRKDSVTVTVFPSGKVFQVTGGGVACMPGPGAPIGINNSEVGILYQVRKGITPVGDQVPGTGGPMTIGYFSDPGTYNVVALSANCVNTMSGAVTVVQFPRPVISNAVIVHNRCHGENSGSVDITVTSGTPSFTYNWSNNALTQDISSLVAGRYGITVTDQKGCTAIDTLTILEPKAPLDSAIVTNVSCKGYGNGGIDIRTGGTPPHIFVWSTGASTEDINSLVPGIYSVFVKDSLNCTSNQSFTITEPALLTISGTDVPVACFGGNNGGIDLTVAGGTQPYSYNWSNNSSKQDPTGLTAGNYSVTVADANGCTAAGAYAVSQPTQMNASTSVVNTSCFGGNDGSIDLTVSGGTAGYRYLWNNNATVQDPAGLLAGNHSVVITDGNGCTKTVSAIIGQPTQVTVSGNVTNAACFGTSSGAIDINANGGTPAYTYSWSNGVTTQDLDNVMAGTYSVTAADANGCTGSRSFTINQPASMQVSNTATLPTCYGGSNGGINIAVTNGTAPYSYSWNNGSANQNLSGLSAGTYAVTVTDAKGCTKVDPIILNNPPMLAATAVPISVSCLGNNQDGGIDLMVSGGTAPYSYLWSNNATTEDLNNLSIDGTYSVTVTDVKGCTATASATVTQPVAITLSGSVNNVSCFGGANGSVNLTTIGGMAPFTYMWSNDATIEDISSIAAGTYSVTVKDARNCLATESFTISQPSTPLVVASTQTNNVCGSNANGSIDLTVSGGGAPYSYQWSNNATTQDVSNLSAADYGVVVIDNNGCAISKTITITAPPALVAAVTPVHANCWGQNSGAVYLAVVGGVSPYSYSWNNNAITEDIVNVPSGSYAVTVTDAKGCTKTVSTIVNQPAKLSTSVTKTDILCAGGANGAVDLTISGGTPTYIYNWSTGAASEDINGLPAGNYGISVMDEKGCIATAATTLTEPMPLATVASETNVLCNNGNTGAIDITVDGGTAPYSYTWNNNATTQDISGLTAGNYNVTVTDAHGCIKTESRSITQPSAINITKSVTNLTCFGGNNGGIDLSVSGGIAPYSYVWNNNATSQDISALNVGTYTVSVTDANSCTKSDVSAIVSATQLIVTGNATHIVCNGANTGAIDLTVSGGATPYTYGWSNNAITQDISNLQAGGYTVVVTDANNCSENISFTIAQPTALSASAVVVNPSCSSAVGSIDLTVAGGVSPYTYVWSNNATTQDLTGIAAGQYSVVITDVKGCAASASATLTQSPGTNMSITGVTTNSSCSGNNGSINITVSGGGPYTYSWSNGATTEDINNLASGTYTVTVTSVGGCSKSQSFSLTSSNGLSLTANVTNVSCNGNGNGSIDLSVSGGTAPYIYDWGSNNSNSNSNSYGWWSWWCGNSNNNNTQDRSALEAGTYTVTVTSANGCTATASFTVTEPTAISVTGIKTNVTCNNSNDGIIDVTVSGGTAPYTYSWYNGGSWCSNYKNINTQDRTGLEAGTYWLKVTDAKGCNKIISFTITEPPSITASISMSPVTAVTNGQTYTIYKGYGPQTVTLTANASGGTPGYTYSWSGSGVSDKTTASVSVTPSSTTTYAVIVTDENGCIKMVTKTIKVMDVSCGNKNDKVKVCHNGDEICIAASAVPAHLAHGCYVGECDDRGGYSKPGESDSNEDTLEKTVVSELTGAAIKIYPNPSSGIFTLDLPAGVMNAHILVTDIAGRIVENRTAMGENQIRFDLQHAAQGVYMIRVASGKDIYNSKITIR